jgi:truncated hemoglobin YjbI
MSDARLVSVERFYTFVPADHRLPPKIRTFQDLAGLARHLLKRLYKMME